MDAADSRRGERPERVRSFSGDQLAAAARRPHDRVRLVCSQPYDKRAKVRPAERRELEASGFRTVCSPRSTGSRSSTSSSPRAAGRSRRRRPPRRRSARSRPTRRTSGRASCSQRGAPARPPRRFPSARPRRRRRPRPRPRPVRPQRSRAPSSPAPEPPPRRLRLATGRPLLRKRRRVIAAAGRQNEETPKV